MRVSLASIEEEKRRREEALEAELRDRAAMARAALEQAERAAATAPVAMPVDLPVAAPQTAPAFWRSWFQLVRPYTAAGLSAACAFAVATAWIGVQAPNVSTASSGVVAQVSVPATDAGNLPTLKSIDTLTSLDRLEAAGALVAR